VLRLALGLGNIGNERVLRLVAFASMTPEQTAAVYDQIAQHWDCPDFDLQYGIRQHERALQFASTAGHALDIGCGSSGRIIDLLLRRGFEVEGLDFSVEMLRRARAHHPQVRFHRADICAWQLPRRYDFIFPRGTVFGTFHFRGSWTCCARSRAACMHAAS